MSNMKSYTDIEQSKKLAELLPLESADMVYVTTGYSMRALPEEDVDANIYPKVSRCWSLAALFNVLPHIQEFYPTFEKINDKYVCRYKDSGIWTNGTNSVDACYEMIINLHEQKLL